MLRPWFAIVVLAALLVVGLTVGAAGCGTAGNPPGGGGPTTDTTSGPDTSTPGSSTTLPEGSINHPTGAADVVLRVMSWGGFLPLEYNFTMIPEFTLYGDGRIIVVGPTTLEWPGKALPNLQTTVISEDAIQAILAAAKEAGLFQNGYDYGEPPVADVGYTTFVINAEGASYKADIYGLGFEDGGSLTMEQQQARAAIDNLRGKLSDPSNFADTELVWEPYDFTALKVYSRAVDTTVSTDSTDVAPNRLPWPLADLASGNEVPNGQGLREMVVSGDDLATLQPLLGQATQITLWKSGDVEYNLYLRPLLPDEAAAL